MKKLASILLLALSFTTVFAQENVVEKYGKMTPAEVAELSKDELAKVPIKYHWATRKGLSFGAEITYIKELNSLMYSATTDLAAAIKAFQLDLGNAATGELTVEQIHTLGERAEFQKIPSILFPSDHSSANYRDFASVKGTMVILDESMAYPINHNKIFCTKSSMSCELEQVTLDLPEMGEFALAYIVSQAFTESYTITKWEGDVIEATQSDTENTCRRLSLSFNFATKEYFYITQNGTGDCGSLGGALGKLEKPRIAKFVDGEEIYKAEFKKLEEFAFEFLSSDYRTKYAKLLEEWNRKHASESEP